MISGSFYIIIYLLIVTLMTFIATSGYNRWGRLTSQKQYGVMIIAFVCLVIMVLFIGTRPTDKAFVIGY